jgi:hypothetical protein
MHHRRRPGNFLDCVRGILLASAMTPNQCLLLQPADRLLLLRLAVALEECQKQTI